MQNCFHLDLPVSCECQWYVHCNWNKLNIYDDNNHIKFFNEKNSADSMVSVSCMLNTWVLCSALGLYAPRYHEIYCGLGQCFQVNITIIILLKNV